MAITARNAAQAEYIVRSRAQQRGVSVNEILVEAGAADSWFVTITVADDDVATLAAAALDEDTQVMHFRNHPHRPKAQ